MRVEELRIGNLVEAYIEPQVSEWVEMEVHVEMLGLMQSKPDAHGYKPIPLNEEWLVRFGFEEIESFYTNADGGYHEDRWRHKKTKLTLWFYLGNFNACSIEGENEWIDVSHVHQLQNLYFALTSEELKIETV